MKIEAPWTDEQVANLNRWQENGRVHPFTCGSGDRMDAAHRKIQERDGGDFGQLVATLDGWVCPACDYRQNWAHDFMLVVPADPLPGQRR
jgi:hypothetical protein